MARSLSHIEQEVRDLSLPDKEELLRVLLEELDGPADPDAEAAWLAEVERRDREISDGSVKCIPADEVFARIDAALTEK
jgi:putative addiction module component (TIGR02574 family)